MRTPPGRWTVTLVLVVVSASVTGPVALGAGQSNGVDDGGERPNGTAPPGVSNGTLTTPSALLETHTSLLVAAGFSANGTTNVTVVRQSVLVDVERTANRTVSANASTYRQSQLSVARAPVATVTREEEFWGNETAEVRRRVENQVTSYNVSGPKPDRRLAAATVLGPYLRSATFTVTATASAGTLRGDTGDAEPIGGERRYRLAATGLTNATRIENRLPNGATNARNFTATVVLDEDGRVHAFEARLEYTIREEARTHTITFDLRELGVASVARPDWVDERQDGGGTDTADASPADRVGTAGVEKPTLIRNV